MYVEGMAEGHLKGSGMRIWPEEVIDVHWVREELMALFRSSFRNTN